MKKQAKCESCGYIRRWIDNEYPETNCPKCNFTYLNKPANEIKESGLLHRYRFALFPILFIVLLGGYLIHASKENSQREAERKESVRKETERIEIVRKEEEIKEDMRKEAERKEEERKDSERRAAISIYMSEIISLSQDWFNLNTKSDGSKSYLFDKFDFIERQSMLDTKLGAVERERISSTIESAKKRVARFADDYANEIEASGVLVMGRIMCNGGGKGISNPDACALLLQQCSDIKRQGVTRTIKGCEPLY